VFVTSNVYTETSLSQRYGVSAVPFYGNYISVAGEKCVSAKITKNGYQLPAFGVG